MAPAQPFPSTGTPTPPAFRVVKNLKSLHLTQTPIYPSLLKIPFLMEPKLIGYIITFDFGTSVRLLDSHSALGLVHLDIRFAPGSVRVVRLTSSTPSPVPKRSTPGGYSRAQRFLTAFVWRF